MRKPWSISTTVRNPERLRDFLTVLKKLEAQEFNEENQIKYQVLLIQEKFYEPQNIPQKFRKYYEKPELRMPYSVAKEIFKIQNYEAPSMRGRQSVNPLNKLGFAIARERADAIKITELGNNFLAGDYDIGLIFFKSLLKLQFPNPWSIDFSERFGFDVAPFIATMHLIYRLNKKSTKKGLNRTEFSIFVPTLINANQMDECVKKIMEFRKEGNKEKYIYNFARKFYGMKKTPQKKINNLYDYGDNIMRYFRLTRYFKVSMDPLGYRWTVDLEPSRMVEIEQLLDMYDGEAADFKSSSDYLDYISDITRPELPWEKTENLKEVALSLQSIASDLIKKEGIKLSKKDKVLITEDVKKLTKDRLEDCISELRKFNLAVKKQLKKTQIMGNLKKLEETIEILSKAKELRKYEPEQFEKLVAEALMIINDEIEIKPNYPVDDDGEPISHSPGNKSDIECFYQNFKAIYEVTLNTTSLQWVQEGQPVQRHLRQFETQHKDCEVFCVFISPRIHQDTYSIFWHSVKNEYDGVPQKIIPMTTEQLAVLLNIIINSIKQGKKFSHNSLNMLYRQIILETQSLRGFSQWVVQIQKTLEDWKRKVISA